VSAAPLHLVTPPDDTANVTSDVVPDSPPGPIVGVFQAIWPVVDRTRPLSDLIPDAREDLPGMLARARCHLPCGMSSVRWSIRLGRDVPGSAGAVEVLVAECPVGRVPADVDALTGERHVESPTRRGPRAVR
jgi:hypothetical protein